MHLAQQAIDDIQVGCNNITALTEAINVTDKKDEIITYTERIQNNIDVIKNSLEQVNLILNENLNKLNELEIDMKEIMDAFDDIDMEAD